MISWSSLPSEIQTIFEKMFKAGFYPVLVGGIVRDYFLTKSWGNDFDVEIRSQTIKIEDWPKELDAFYLKLKEDYKVELFNYHIAKLKVGPFSVELASPRLEIFDINNFTHKNFTANFFPELEDKMAFKRRDFTINALGVALLNTKQVTFIDPYNGAADLKNRTLNVCSDDFFQDPVRFLRLIRFKVKLDFTIAPNLLKTLSKFNLKQLSTFYFLKEWRKAGNYNAFIEIFFQLKESLNIVIPEKISQLKIVETLKLDSLFFGKLTTNSQLYLLILIEKMSELSSNDFEFLSDFFEIKQKERVKYKELATDLKNRIYFQEVSKYQKTFPSFYANELNRAYLLLLEAKFAPV